MCLAKVYMESGGESPSREAVLLDVTWIEVQPKGLLLRDLLGNEKSIRGSISTIDFEGSVVTVVEQVR